MEARIDTGEMKELIKKCEGFSEMFTVVRRSCVEAAGRSLKLELDNNIGSSGRVAKWQELKYGSRGGYVSIRPANGKAENYLGKVTPYAIGHVTNSINSGHKTKGYRGKFNSIDKGKYKKGAEKVPGKYFYELTKTMKLDKAVKEALEQISDTMVRYLEE